MEWRETSGDVACDVGVMCGLAEMRVGGMGTGWVQDGMDAGWDGYWMGAGWDGCRMGAG